jgi:hypothetical protein
MPYRGKNRGKDDFLPRKKLRFASFTTVSPKRSRRRFRTILYITFMRRQARSEKWSTQQPSFFVGRDRELQQLTSAFHAAAAGHGPLIMLVGDAAAAWCRRAAAASGTHDIVGPRTFAISSAIVSATSRCNRDGSSLA